MLSRLLHLLTVLCAATAARTSLRRNSAFGGILAPEDVIETDNKSGSRNSTEGGGGIERASADGNPINEAINEAGGELAGEMDALKNDLAIASNSTANAEGVLTKEQMRDVKQRFAEIQWKQKILADMYKKTMGFGDDTHVLHAAVERALQAELLQRAGTYQTMVGDAVRQAAEKVRADVEKYISSKATERNDDFENARSALNGGNDAKKKDEDVQTVEDCAQDEKFCPAAATGSDSGKCVADCSGCIGFMDASGDTCAEGTEAPGKCNADEDCGDNGECNEGVCECAEGYDGETCSECASGFKDDVDQHKDSNDATEVVCVAIEESDCREESKFLCPPTGLCVASCDSCEGNTNSSTQNDATCIADCADGNTKFCPAESGGDNGAKCLQSCAECDNFTDDGGDGKCEAAR